MSGTSSPPPVETGASVSTGASIDGFPPRPSAPLTLAVSECLLGRAVRYDGTDAADSLPRDALEPWFRYRGICPEVGIGMGVPRAPIRLVGDPSRPRVLGVADPDVDVTDALAGYARARAAELDDVAGYVFMRGSPSCGLHDVKVYPADAAGRVLEQPERVGRGAFAAAVLAARPLLPAEENERLYDPARREHFLVRTFAYAHWRALERAGITAARLVEFHSRYKYLLMAHSVGHYQRAGRLLGSIGRDVSGVAEAYAGVLMEGLSQPATRGRHLNVLEHLQGYFADSGEGTGRRAVAAAVDRYRRSRAPLSHAVGVLREQLAQEPNRYLERQVYFEPYPGAGSSASS